MGGNGTIGGLGSCKASFTVTDGNRKKTHSWECHDSSVGKKFRVTVGLPGRKKETVTITGKKKVTIKWH